MQVSTLVRKYSDNTGSFVLKCLKVVGTGNRQVAKVGDILRVSIKKKRKLKVKKFALDNRTFLALVIGLTGKNRRFDGSFVAFDSNRVLLLDRQQHFMGDNFYGPFAREVDLKRFKGSRVLTRANKLL